MADQVYTLARWLVFGCFLATGIIALVHLGVQSRSLEPFGFLARTTRRLSEPLVRWMERRLLRAGGNPQAAPYWLFGLTVVGGLLGLGVLQWLFVFVDQLSTASGDPRYLFLFIVRLAFQLVMIALLIRVIASWVGISEYRKWMRPTVFLTEWLLAPLRKVIPTMGMIDITPFVAYLVLLVLQRIVFGILTG